MSINRFRLLLTRRELAAQLDIRLRDLTYILFVKKPDNYYQTFSIPKRNGGVRTISSPMSKLKHIQRRLAKILAKEQQIYWQKRKINNRISHGFVSGHSTITNAMPHQNKRFLLNIDLENFFETFHFGRVLGFFLKNDHFRCSRECALAISNLVCYRGSLPQGAPTSPVISNLIFNIVDMRIVRLAKRYRLNYTRFADDLSFSTNNKSFDMAYTTFLEELDSLLERSGFSINHTKTRIQYHNSKQVVTGLIVNKVVNIDREYYRRTRNIVNNYYLTDEIRIDGQEATIKQLEGRLEYIRRILVWKEQCDASNCEGIRRTIRRFLFFRHFVNLKLPLIITEGKTDSRHIRAALLNLRTEYPDLIGEPSGDHEGYKITFLKRTKKIKNVFDINLGGGASLCKLLGYYGYSHGKNDYEFFNKNYRKIPQHPVILMVDNEKKAGTPLIQLLNHALIKKNKEARKAIKDKYWVHIIGNVYLCTTPLIDDKQETEIEDLLSEAFLQQKIGERVYSKKDESDEKHVGKNEFSRYVLKNYQTIDFAGHRLLLNTFCEIIGDYRSRKLLAEASARSSADSSK